MKRPHPHRSGKKSVRTAFECAHPLVATVVDDGGEVRAALDRALSAGVDGLVVVAEFPQRTGRLLQETLLMTDPQAAQKRLLRGFNGRIRSAVEYLRVARRASARTWLGLALPGFLPSIALQTDTFRVDQSDLRLGGVLFDDPLLNQSPLERRDFSAGSLLAELRAINRSDQRRTLHQHFGSQCWWIATLTGDTAASADLGHGSFVHVLVELLHYVDALAIPASAPPFFASSVARVSAGRLPILATEVTPGTLRDVWSRARGFVASPAEPETLVSLARLIRELPAPSKRADRA